MIDVVIVDDEALVRTGFTMILNATDDLRVVGTATGEDALDVVAATHPDVVLLDIRMPHVDGLTLLRLLGDLPQPPAIAMLTTFDADEYVMTALRGGAAGFLLKDTEPEQLAHYIRALAAGGVVLSPRASRVLLDDRSGVGASLDEGARRVATLTDQEQQVLRLVAEGLSNAEIGDQLTVGAGTASRQHERELYAQTVLARERNQLAREMHDVVSHQVSLIAVQAEALQVTASDPAAKEAASAIRSLASTTLEELRSMVMLLRAAGTRSPGLAPQPTVSDLEDLVTASGLAVTMEGSLPPDLGSARERAVYRTVQEALTNVRKHAPGSAVTVRQWSDERSVAVAIVNGCPTSTPLRLPSSHLGLLGLHERAELLGGTLVYGAEGDGFRVELHLPRMTK